MHQKIASNESGEVVTFQIYEMPKMCETKKVKHVPA